MPQRWAVALLRAYVRRTAARRFHGWWADAHDLDALREADRPLLLVPNHTSWWDGFLALELAAWLGRTFHVMMRADQLAATPFFARCGAFPVHHGDARRAASEIASARALLAPGASVWVFPQGRRRPAGAPIAVGAGAARLACGGGPVRVVPVAMRYAFLSEELPEAFAWLGEPWDVDAGDRPAEVRRQMAATMASALAALDERLLTTERAGFTAIVEGAPSVNKRREARLARAGRLPIEAARNG